MAMDAQLQIAAAQQRNLPIESVGSRRSPAHLGEHRRQNQTRQVVAQIKHNIQEILKGVRPLERAFVTFRAREK